MDAPFLTNLSLGIIPFHILGNVPVRELRAHSFSRQPVGAGPYVFDRIIPGQFTIMTRSPHFWNPPRPYIDRIVFRVYPDINVTQAAFEAGDIDQANLTPDSVERVRREMAGRARFDEAPSMYDVLHFNLENSILSDRRVRQALKLAIDRPAMIGAVLNGFGTIMNAHQVPVSWASGATNLNTYAFNQARAGQLLDEAGWRIPAGQSMRRRGGSPTGELMRLNLMVNSGNVVRGDVVTMAVRQWREIGVDAHSVIFEWSVMLRNYALGRFDVIAIGWGLPIDPDPFTFLHSAAAERGADGTIHTSNRGRFINEEVDRLIDAGRATVNVAERRAIYHRIDQIVNYELPMIWLFQRMNVRGISNRLQGVILAPTGTIIHEARYLIR